MSGTKHFFTCKKELDQAAASYIATMLEQTDTEQDAFPFTLVLTGGSTPVSIYRLLASNYRNLPWSKVHFFWGDERYVSPTTAESNYRMAYDQLLSQLDITPAQIHRIPTELPEPVQAAAAYEQDILKFFTQSGLRQLPQPSFKLTLLGMGLDGHIASLFPASAALDARKHLITSVDKAPLAPQVPRITMTLPLINNSETILFLISGRKKTALLKKLEEEHIQADSYYPVTLVRARRELVWFISEEE